MHIANQDPENLFCLSFQTLPSTSNGVAHILEHTVLCGSEKFPIKDPFFSMTRRSLNTYMNALTGQDFTCYPASSQVEKDFYNLLAVYLDAVFHPELKKTSFLQEGHRLEFTEPKNPKSPLQFQGVVFNEMKGALSNADSRLWDALMKHLTPDLPYGVNSGGEPSEIPNLTYEELVEFHKTFYHPSRCLFFFYGNLPLSRHLDFLLDNQLEKSGKLALLPPLPKQKRFTSPVFAAESYPAAEGESLEKKAIIALSWLTVPLSSQEEVLALCLLDSILMDTDASPLKKELLQSNLCTQAESSVDIEMSEIPFSIVCRGCEAADADQLRNLIFETLKSLDSFSQEQIEASLHQLEFQRMEIGAEGIPFGLTLFFRAGIIKQHGGESENALFIHTLFNDLRQHLADPQFLPNLLHKYILDNPHCVQLILTPDSKLDQKEKQEEEQRLAKIRPTIDEKALLAQTDTLAKYQEQIESQSLDCLPKLGLQDIPRNTPDFSLSFIEKKNIDVFHHDCFTNHILYADLVFDLPAVAQADLPLLSLYTRFLTELGCGGRNWDDNLRYQQAHTGGVEASLSLHVTNNPDISRPTLSLRGKALSRNKEFLLGIFADFAKGADCSDGRRIKELLAQHATDLQSRLSKNAINYAVQTSLSGFSSASFVYDQWNGLPYFQAVMNWIKDPDSVIAELERIQQHVLAKGKPQLVVSCDTGTFRELEQNNILSRAFDSIEPRPLHPWKNEFSLPHVEPQARLIASPVAFTAWGFRTASYTDPESPYLRLSTELLDNCHLHKEIREKGGAYGCGASYSPSSGNYYLYSFRDPHLAKTVATFHKSIEKIHAGKFTERDLEEAKFGVMQSIDAPIPPGNRAITAFSWKRAGRSYEQRQRFRQQILAAKKSDVTEAVQRSILERKKVLVTYLGDDLLKKEKKKLKEPLSTLPIEPYTNYQK